MYPFFRFYITVANTIDNWFQKQQEIPSACEKQLVQYKAELGIIGQLSGNFLRGKAHIYTKSGGDVPWAVGFVLFIWPELSLNIAYVINTCKNHRLESGCDVPVQISGSELCQEVKENLVIRCGINLVYDKNHWPWGMITPAAETVKDICQPGAVWITGR